MNKHGRDSLGDVHTKNQGSKPIGFRLEDPFMVLPK